MIPTVKKVFDQGLSQDRNVGEDQDGEGNEETNEEEKEDKEEKECREEEKSDDKDTSENNVEEKNSKDEDKTEIRPLRKGKIESLKTKSLFQCTQCPYKSNALGVQSHMLRRHNICQYFCGVCAFESENEAIVTEHFKKEHPTDDLAISRGFAKLNTSENKTDIMAKKKPKKICAIRTLKRSKDTARFKPAGVQGPKRDSPAECPICGFKSRYSGVQRHISMIHGLLKWQCGKCGIQLFSKGETFEHSLTVHDTHAPCVIRSFFEVEKIKELKDSNSLIVEKNGKVKIGAPGEGMVVKSTPKQAAHAEPTTPTKSKKEEIVKDTQCPECSFSSNVKGVQRHLMLIHKICRWQCKICGFGSLDKHVTLEHSVDMHEGIDPKIVRAFVDIDRYNAEKRLNASDEQELQNQSANRQEYLFDFDETSSNENYMDDASEKTLDPPVVEKSDVKAVSPHTSLKSKEEKSAAKLSEPQSKKLSKSLSSPAAVSLDAPVFSPAEVAKKRTKTPSPRALSLDVPASSATGDSENEMPTKKKRGRPKGSGTAFKGTVAIPKKEVSSTFVLKPKELNLLQQGFSCVYCVYAAPLRHQVRLHCYDKHTNHPACLMEFKVDTHGFRSDGVIDLVGDSTDSYIKGKGKSENAQVETQADGNMKAKKQKACDNSEDKEVDQPAVKISKLSTDTQQNSTEKDSKLEELKENTNEMKDKNACLENGFKSGKDISEGKSDSFDTASTHSGQDMEVDELHISEIFDNGKRFKSSRKQRKKFDNPLKTLVNKLQTGRINLEDPFHGTLDEVDSILFQFGVRTLNMDMLTQQQFSNFISKFGADLQPA
ncbi:hypothetical protein FSP39_014384 [Pinctada imbricata]|uniref:C2H2-type domain-containing protein n=1 Tax=Pinctada imbricata TaxID=66713 RepID=A0AA88XG64_PINIB|nr:hypothetical protein FSP39_014384 [Pinctada imbricata]